MIEYLPKLLIKLLNFSLLLLLMIALCINSLVSYAKIFPVMFFLIESITLLKISLILILFCLNLNISKCSLTLYYTIRIIVRERVIYDRILLDGLAINELPKNKLDAKDTFIPLWRRIIRKLPFGGLPIILSIL